MTTNSNAKIKDYARENNDAGLMEVAYGGASIWDYLSNYIDANDLKDLKISDKVKRTIGASFKSNARRRNQLEKWMKEESKIGETDIQKNILEMYKNEADLLDNYAYLILCDFLGI